MTRLEVLQKIIDTKKDCSYLEIGVYEGDTFLRIKAKKKVAVDPNFIIPRSFKLKWCFRNFSNFFAKYYETTSDSYFSRTEKDYFDVVFIDGLHTYDQSLRDVMNSLEKLRPNGVIVMHDCNPLHYAAAYPAKSLEHVVQLNLPGWNGAWQGDVWKTICFLRSNRNDLQIFVMDCDDGLGIITRGQPGSCLDLNNADLSKMTYEDLEKNREMFLNLQSVSFLSEFLKSI